MSLSIPTGSALCNAVLCFGVCRLAGMTGTSLSLAATIAGVVTFAAMVSVQLLAARQTEKSESR